MKSDWQQVKSIVQDALDLDPDERWDFVARRCGRDTPLSDEVIALLRSEQTLGDFISQPAYVRLTGDLTFGDQELKIGDRLGRYEVIGELGRGGMGTVYLARDDELDRQVALKILPSELYRHPDAAERFVREARIVSALNHPNVITIHEIGRAGTIDFIATEFVDGRTLRQHISAGPVPTTEAIDIGSQVLAALAAAHHAGFIHRDIKPENIVIRTDGLVKVLDFGIAKLTGSREAPSGDNQAANSSSSIAAGTPKYMSPEQRRGETLDQRSDIWSFGAVFAEMLTGRVPRDGENVLTDLHDPAPSRSAGVAIRRFVEKCLATPREKRYSTADHALEDLKKIKSELSNQAQSASLFTSARTKYAVGVLVVVLAILVGSLLYSGLFRQTSAAVPEIRNLAVLPVEAIESNTGDTYFEDGITEELINDLSHLSDLRVISRTSVMRYRDNREALSQIARELNVEAVVLSTVQRSGDAVRFSVKLVHATTGRPIWEDGYERSQADLPALQKEITRDIAREISIKLTPRESALLSSSRSVDPLAYEEYLKGRFFLNKRNEDSIKTAISHFETSIARDPELALAHAFLADAYFALGTEIISALPSAAALEKGGVEAARAVALDDSLAEAQTSLGVIQLYSWRWAEAEASLKRALELNPNYAAAHSWYALYCVSQGRVGEAIARMYRARDLDPLSPHIAQNVGWMLHYAGQHQEEIQQYRRALELDPDFLFARRRMAGAYRYIGDVDAAIAEHEKVIAKSGRKPMSLLPLAHTYARSGRRSEAKKILREVASMEGSETVSSYALAVAYAALGDDRTAFEYLNRAYEQRSYALVFIKVTKDFDDSIRRDPRFVDILRRLELTQVLSFDRQNSA